MCYSDNCWLQAESERLLREFSYHTNLWLHMKLPEFLAQTLAKTGSLFMFLWPVTIFFLLLLAVVDTWYDLLLKNPQAEQKLRLSVSLL